MQDMTWRNGFVCVCVMLLGPNVGRRPASWREAQLVLYFIDTKRKRMKGKVDLEGNLNSEREVKLNTKYFIQHANSSNFFFTLQRRNIEGIIQTRG